MLMNEKLLIAGCKRGDPEAYKKLYDLYAPAMMSVCMRYVNNKETAQDLLQEGFITIFTKIGTYSHSGSFAGWIRRIFVTTALQHLRSNDTLRYSMDIEEYTGLADEVDVSALERISTNELMACVAKLPEGYRTVFNMFAIEGYSHSEIAEMLNIQESTSRSQFVRARKMLQKGVESLMSIKDAR